MGKTAQYADAIIVGMAFLCGIYPVQGADTFTVSNENSVEQGDTVQLFMDANKFYRDEQYRNAALRYEKLVQSGLSDEEVGKKVGMIFPRGMFFLQLLEPEGKYHYAGKGVKLGDADTAIFWYRPEGSDTYRVIYGDLSVKEVAPENLPK